MHKKRWQVKFGNYGVTRFDKFGGFNYSLNNGFTNSWLFLGHFGQLSIPDLTSQKHLHRCGAFGIMSVDCGKFNIVKEGMDEKEQLEKPRYIRIGRSGCESTAAEVSSNE